jgi:hypothetical protein
MTLMDRGISAVRQQAIGQSFEIRWASLRQQENSSMGERGGVVRCEFVLRLEIINREHAVVEAWVESPTSRQQALDRQPMRIVLGNDERAVHVDVIDEHQSPPQRIAALSIPHSPPDAPPDSGPDSATSAMYAQTSLLRKAGFAAGTHDRPRVLRDVANAADAATA